jgi:hypothetical protein
MPKYYVKFPNNKIVINANDSFDAILRTCKNYKLSVKVGEEIVVNESGFLWENDVCTVYKILKAINE